MMKKPIHTILCWFLAVALVWLPLPASAGTTVSSASTHSCHEMNSVVGHHSEDTVTEGHAAAERSCCDHCIDADSCDDVNTCASRISYNSIFIGLDQNLYHQALLSLTITEHITQYHSQIISPENRPPVV